LDLKSILESITNNRPQQPVTPTPKFSMRPHCNDSYNISLPNVKAETGKYH